MADIRGYHHVSLSVNDLDKSVEWYQKTLGFETAAELQGDGFRRTRLKAHGDGVTLTLTAHDKASGQPFDERRAGVDHIAFDVGASDDVQELKRRFEELGVEHSEVKEASSGAAMITLRDPDNIQLEVFGGKVDPRIAGGRSGA